MVKSLKIIPDKCTGCMQCELACSWVQTGTFQPSRSVIRVNVFDEEASYAPFTCTQCDEAWCMNACPVNAIAVDPVTGAKVVLDRVCVGSFGLRALRTVRRLEPAMATSGTTKRSRGRLTPTTAPV